MPRPNKLGKTSTFTLYLNDDKRDYLTKLGKRLSIRLGRQVSVAELIRFSIEQTYFDEDPTVNSLSLCKIGAMQNLLDKEAENGAA